MWQIIINGPGYFDTPYDLSDGTTTLGRADENDIVLSGDLVSRKHARIHVAGEVIRLEDLGSRNGSRLNGERVKGTVDLKVSDTVHVGENSLGIRQPGAVEAATTEVVDLSAGGVRRFGNGLDIASAVILAKDVRDSVVLRVLDNILPFDAGSGPPLASDVTPPHGTQAPLTGEKQRIGYESLVLLYKVSETLSTAASLQAFLDDTADRVMKRVNATTAVVLLRHPTGVMVPAAVRHSGKLEQGEVPVSDAVVSAALAKGAAIAVADVRDDSRFADRESVVMYGIDQVLCVPIGQHEPFAGVLYLNKAGKDRGELEPLLDLCTAVSHLIASGVEKFALRDKPPADDRLRRALERFHAPETVERRLADLVKAGPGKLTQLEERTVTTLFADIAGFTALVEKLPPDRVLEVLNELHQRMTALVFSFEGTVDKFLGDAVMAVFGAPYGRGDDALRAVRAALVMRSDWKKVMARRPPRERCDLKIALNTGKVLAGNVGSESRLDFCVVGEPVNVAAWLAAVAEPGQVLITGKTLAAIGARFDVIPLGERALHGSKLRSAVFEVVEEDPSQNTASGVHLR